MKSIDHVTLQKKRQQKSTTLGCVNICALNVHPCFLNNQSLIDTCQLPSDFL